MARTYAFAIVAVIAVLLGTRPEVQSIAVILPGLIRAAVRIIFYTDLVGFEAKHRELYAQAEKDGNYSAVTIHYYSVMGDFLQTVIGDYWHWVPHKQGLTMEQNFDDFNRKVSEELKLKPNQTLCEMGCGICRTGRDIAKKAGARFIGVTMSPREVELGMAELKAAGAESWAMIKQGDYKAMPLEDESCDAVFAIYTLKYSEAGEPLNKALKEAARILRPGGKFGSYEILKSATYDANNASHAEWTYRISYHTGMPPLSEVKHFREDPPKVGLNLVLEDNFEDHADRAPSYAGYPLSVADPPDFYVKLLNFVEDIGLKKGFRVFAEEFLHHPVVDFCASMKAAVVTTSTLFIYEKAS